MTDEELVAKKLAFIETCLRELRQLARPGQLAADIREERFVEHTLQLGIQAALDIASHIVSNECLAALQPFLDDQKFVRPHAAVCNWPPATRL